MASSYHIDVDYAQRSHHNYYCCGDRFLTHRLQEERRVVSVLSDGLGSGAIASVLSTLTASMALRLTERKQEVEYTAQTIMDTLPIDSRKGLSYSTFTIADVDAKGKAKVIEFDNPPVLLIRDGRIWQLPRELRTLRIAEGAERRMFASQVQLQVNDRLLMMSDGVTQSGMGQHAMPFGYGLERLADFLQELMELDPEISSHRLCGRIVDLASDNDLTQPMDDITCGVIHFRRPRRLLVVTGPPFREDKDKRMAEHLRDFPGRRIIAGGTTSQIVSRAWGVECQVKPGERSDGLPPRSEMPGVDLVTEGVLTLSRVLEILRGAPVKASRREGPAWRIVHHLLSSDSIEFLVGTRVNLANYDPKLPVELATRRSIVREIVKLLQDKYTKEVNIELI